MRNIEFRKLFKYKQLMYSLLVSVISICLTYSGQAQKIGPLISCSISGLASVQLGSTSTYTITGGCTATSWSATNASIQSHTSTSVTILFNVIASSSLITANGASLTKTVTITIPPLTGGTINNPTQSIFANTEPVLLTASAPTGGTGSYSFQWYSSPNNTTFTAISGATNQSFQPPVLSAQTYYKRFVTSTGDDGAYTTNTATISIYPPLNAGSVSPSAQTINYNTAPAGLTLSGVSGGSGTYTYQWQSGTVFGIYNDISGATSTTYAPAAITATTYYRVAVTNAGLTLYSNYATVYVNPQIQDYNFIREREIHKAGIMDSAAALSLTSPFDVAQTTQYFDGLGRQAQTVAMQQSPLQHDLVSFNVYDQLGREAQKYLPYTASTSDGNYKTTSQNDQNTFNAGQFPGEQYYYGQSNFEPSPLNRVITNYAPGLNWVGASRGVNSQFQMNAVSDSVRNWTIAFPAGSLPTTSSTYANGTLYKNISTDEAGHSVVEYKDLNGKVILKKVQLAASPGTAHTGWLCTYYIYDDLDNLRFVIQPVGVQLINSNWIITTAIATELCFRYEYDARKRMIIKKIPGAGETWMVYDTKDRLVMTQDSALRSLQKWMYTRFDSENRPDSTGLITDPTNYNNLSFHLNAAAVSSSYPTVASYTSELLTQTYYDDYSWAAGAGMISGLNTTYTANGSYFNTSYNTSPVYAVQITQFTITRGMVTGTRKEVLGSGGSQFLYGVSFYDDRGRIIQSQSTNYTGAKDTATTQYDFTSKPIRTLLNHGKNGNTAQAHKVLTKMDYDHGSRLKHIWKSIDGAGADQLIDSMQYNELGQLRVKYLGNNIDSLVYDFNIRGWLTGINKNYVGGTTTHYFGMELGYDKSNSIASTTSYNYLEYNGNIAGTIWKSAGDGIGRKYDYKYDNVNRITRAEFNQNTTGTTWDNSTLDFSVWGFDSDNGYGIKYDANGNILMMIQAGWKAGLSTIVDALRYTYFTNSNKLQQVTDDYNDQNTKLGDFHYNSSTKTSTDYSYDGNGNLITDNNKLIDKINYNYLSLPTLVHPNTKGNIQYVYDASGTKLAKITSDSTSRHTTTTLYVAGFVYQQTDTITAPNAGTDTLQFIGHEEGRVRWAYHKYMTGSSAYGFEYDFFEKDHLGNTRIVLTQQKDTARYLASGEAVYRVTENQLFSNLTTTTIARTAALGYPADLTITNPNDTVFKVNGNVGGHKMGPSLLLKVMSGDRIDMAVQSFYNSGTTNTPNSSLTDVLASLATGIVNLASGAKGSLTDLNNQTTSPIYAALNSFLPSNDPNPTGKPKAYLNWILLDDQLKYVSSYPQSGAVVVGAAGTLNVLGYTGIPITKSGFLYIWVSNETPNWDVFFDNLKVVHYPGPLLEESHYYPFGLTMAGISSKALKPFYTENKFRYNKGSEFANKEFSDGTGLEMYETHLRDLDPQLGRWWQIDSKPNEMYSPYSAMNDNPIRYNDPLGDTVNQKGFTEKEFLKDLDKGIKVNDKNNPYYFDKKGNLQINDKKYGLLSDKQKAIVDNVRGAISSKVTFTVQKVTQNDKINGNITGQNGEVIKSPTFKEANMAGQTQQIDKTHVLIKVVDPRDGINQDLKDPNGKSIPSSPTWLSIYHEVGGHGFYKYVEGDNRGCKAIDYENEIRSFNGMQLRGYDGAHPDK